MINSVKFGNLNSPNNFSAKKTENDSQCKNLSFGNYAQEDYESHPIRDLFLTLTGDAVGLVGFNTVLWGIQDFVNSKLLVGKINKHFTSKISAEDDKKIVEAAKAMIEKVEPNNKDAFSCEISNKTQGKAFYTDRGNFVHVSSDQKSSLFHEIGHAMEENNTKIFKWLQRGRGNYAILSLGLYAILSQTRKNQQDNQHKSFLSKLLSPTVVVPMLAFSPELITEAKASITGVRFLEKNQKTFKMSDNLIKNIKRSYLACFGTYLFIPVSIILMEHLQHSAQRALQQRKMRQHYRQISY